MSISKSQADALSKGFFDNIGSKEDLKPESSLSALYQLAGGLVDQAQRNLNKVDRVASGSLSDSIKVLNPETVGNSVRIDIIANFYYKFIDEGVRGLGGGNGNGRYSFKNRFVGKKMLFAIRKWLIREGLKSRTHTGGKPISKRESKREKRKGSDTSNSTAYAIATAVKYKGLKKTQFFTSAVNYTQAQAKTELAKALKIDIINVIPKKLNGNNTPA